MPRVRFLVTWNPNKVLDPEHKTKFPRVMGLNLVRLAYQEFNNKKHNDPMFENFEYMAKIDPLSFFQLCVGHSANTLSVVVNKIQDCLVNTD